MLENTKKIVDCQIIQGSVVRVVEAHKKNYVIRDNYQIFVKSFSGRTLTFEVEKNNTIIDLKKKIQDAVGIPIEQQRIVYSGIQFEDNYTLGTYCVSPESTFHLF